MNNDRRTRRRHRFHPSSVEGRLLISRTWGFSLLQFLVHGYESCLTGRVLIIVERLDGVVVIDTRANYRATFSAVVTINCRFVSECHERYASRMCHPFLFFFSFSASIGFATNFASGIIIGARKCVRRKRRVRTRTHVSVEKEEDLLKRKIYVL